MTDTALKAARRAASLKPDYCAFSICVASRSHFVPAFRSASANLCMAQFVHKNIDCNSDDSCMPRMPCGALKLLPAQAAVLSTPSSCPNGIHIAALIPLIESWRTVKTFQMFSHFALDPVSNLCVCVCVCVCVRACMRACVCVASIACPQHHDMHLQRRRLCL